MEIKRDAYLQQLIERKDNGLIKVITGIRRCGKSFLLFTIFKRYLLENGVDTDHIIEIALDGIENEELRDPKVCYKFIKDAMKDNTNYELRYLLLFYRDLEEKIVYIAETLQNPQAANNLLDDEPNEGWCMMLLKPM